MLSTRPKIAELALQLYGRSLHPELFEVCRSRDIARGDIEGGGYTARIEITHAGHVVTWRHGLLTLTEVAASTHQPLPTKRRLMSHRLDQELSDTVTCRGRVQYSVSFDMDVVSPEAFRAYQQEIEMAGLQQGLIHRFGKNGRVGVGAISYIHAEARDRSLQVRSLHTFPDDCAVMKCQSCFSLPK